MQRTVKGLTMDLVAIKGGQPVVFKAVEFATTDRKTIERQIKKKNCLAVWETAKEFEKTYILDDEIFFKYARVKDDSDSKEATDNDTETEADEEATETE